MLPVVHAKDNRAKRADITRSCRSSISIISIPSEFSLSEVWIWIFFCQTKGVCGRPQPRD